MYYEKIIKCPHKVQLRKFYFELYHFFFRKGILETIKKKSFKKKKRKYKNKVTLKNINIH
jgi:hypothetical protein